MIGRPPLRAIVGALILAALAYGLLAAPLRPLAWAGWILGFLLLAGTLALIGRPGGTRLAGRGLSSIPAAEQASAEHLLAMLVRALGIEPEEGEQIVAAAWRGDLAPLARHNIIIRPPAGAVGAQLLAIIERRVSRLVRYADAAPWEPGATSFSPRAGADAASPSSDPSIPAGLEALFGTRSPKSPARGRPAPFPETPAAERAGQTRLDWEGFDPADGDPPPDLEEAPRAGSLADFAEESDAPAPVSAADIEPDAEGGGVALSPLPDIDPYAEEWDEAPAPSAVPAAVLDDEDDPFAALFPDELGSGDDEVEEDPWAEPSPGRRPNPFAPDEPLADPYGPRGGGAFRAPLRDEERRRR